MALKAPGDAGGKSPTAVIGVEVQGGERGVDSSWV